MPDVAAIREADLVLSRRAEIVRLYALGLTQARIAEELDITPHVVAYQLKKAREAWTASAMLDFNEKIGLELERLDWIEEEARQAWERSKMDLVTQNRYLRKDGETRDMLRRQNRDGESRFLQIILDCVEKRTKLMGVLKLPDNAIPGEVLQDRITVVEVLLSATTENHE